MTEVEELNQWFKNETAKGLIDFKVTLDPFRENNGPATPEQIEELAREINLVNALLDDQSNIVERGDVF